METERSRLVLGEASVRRIGAFAFPVWELANEGVPMARLGRFSSWSIYFGRGQRIQTADGENWRLGSFETGGEISAVLLDGLGARLAVGSVGKGVYGINGRDFAYMLFPHRSDRLSATDWTLSSPSAESAAIRRAPLSLTAHIPVPLSAVVMALALVKLGVPGERKLTLPSVQWTRG